MLVMWTYKYIKISNNNGVHYNSNDEVDKEIIMMVLYEKLYMKLNFEQKFMKTNLHFTS